MKVTTQLELDAALEAGTSRIVIDSPRGVWLTISESGSSTVRASGSSTVRAYGSSTVEAYGSSTVRAYGSSTVEAYDSSTVRAYSSSTVEAYGSSTVEAYGSSTVEASGSSTVRAYDSSTVRAYDSSTVRASKYVAVHLHSSTVTITGGVVIDVTALDLTDPATWTEYHGVDVTDGHAVLYKAVSADLDAGQQHRTTHYPLGGTVAAPDWDPSHRCGHGLHFGFTPGGANEYYQGDEPTSARRFLACRVALDALIPLDDKAKAPSCEVLYEVDIMGRRINA